MATKTDPRTKQLHEAIAAVGNQPSKLRTLIAEGNFAEIAQLGGDETTRAILQLIQDLLTPTSREQITSPANAAAIFMAHMAHLDQEVLAVLVLNTKNRVLKLDIVYRGSLNSSLIRVGEVFKTAIRLNAAAIIVAHNHPSQDPTPSPEDVSVTRQIVEAGELLDIEVLDHLVIGQGRYTSMRERGLGFRTL